MNPFELGTESAVLRVEIKGDWTPQGFAKLLSDLHDLYRRLNALDFFDRAVASEDSENERHYRNQQYDRQSNRFRRLFYGYDERYGPDDYRHVAPNFEVMIATAEQFTGEPALKSVQYSSPGWIELLGSWNPIKVIADTISEWRKQNTEREKNRQQADLEAMRIRAGVLSSILANDNLLKSGDPRLYQAVFEHILNPAYGFVTGIAVDSRITSVKMLSPGETPENNEEEPV
jgi:hypothetical protein